MAISAQNASYLTNGPASSGQQLAGSALAALEVAFVGTATFTGDGSTTTATLNYIDGTQALTFTPTAILCARVGGNDTGSEVVVSAVDAGNSNKTATITFSAAPGNGKTVQVAFFILK